MSFIEKGSRRLKPPAAAGVTTTCNWAGCHRGPKCRHISLHPWNRRGLLGVLNWPLTVRKYTFTSLDAFMTSVVLRHTENFPLPLIMAKRKKSYKDDGVGHDERDGRLANYNVVRPARRGTRTMEMECTSSRLQAWLRCFNRYDCRGGLADTVSFVENTFHLYS